ncbi:MAG: phosphoglucosamine mutase [Nocardioidaceae bacterium]|nr:phosphoglucosamine mutase [Nocardioidaceae bacterium]
MARLFGTDGVRGVANRDLTAELALHLAAAAAQVLVRTPISPRQAGVSSRRRPVAVVGRDPRASGEFLEAAVVAGLASAGVDVRLVGVLPTPGVSHLTAALDADFGVMLSASHNPMPDNGIKFLARGGYKLDDTVEDAIEAAMTDLAVRPTGAGVGRVSEVTDAVSAYVEKLATSVSQPLTGLKVVLDCAQGAAFEAAPLAFARAGAQVVAIHNNPSGLDINEACGSTHLESLQAAVVAEAADAGFAFDGDADRCLAVDASGAVVDGDQILAVLALSMRESGALADDTVVATVMSNLGFLVAMRAAGLVVIPAKVGDRYVLEEMRSGGFSLGGEQSGHVIMADLAATGDGVLAALHVAARMASTGRTLADLAGVMERMPQVLINVSDVDQDRVASDPTVIAAVRDAETELGAAGRVLLRPSGTEPVVRVMVEAASAGDAQLHAQRLADVVKAELAL